MATSEPGPIGATVDLLADGVVQGSRSVAKHQRSLLRRTAGALGRLTGKQALFDNLGDAVWLPFAATHAQVRWISRLTSLAAGQLDALVPARSPAPVPLRSDVVGTPPWLWDGFLGLVNGLVGDHLAAAQSPLAIPMQLRWGDIALVAPDGSPDLSHLPREPRRCVVFVHGLTATEWSWAWEAERQHGSPETTYASLLHAQLDPEALILLVRYNTGLGIPDNGARLAELLAAVHATVPLTDLSLVGHSMGGLVSRSAVQQSVGAPWVEPLSRVITLGSPHLGAPLEQLGQLASSVLGAIALPGTRIPADVIDARSAGIRDLRAGRIIAADAARRPGEPSAAGWLTSVTWHRVVGTVLPDPAHPVAGVAGDGMVPAASAESRGDSPARGEVVRVGGVPHVELANHPAVWAHLAGWLAEAQA